MPDEHFNAERRQRRAIQRLGTDNPICCMCGETNPHCLELHHIAGRAFGDEKVIVCRNCHRKLSDAQEDHTVKLKIGLTLEEQIGHYLSGLADLLKLIAERLKEFGSHLLALAKAKATTDSGDPS